jgi:hypothetical protein
MVNGFALHDNSTASPASAEILKRVQQAWGFVPNGRSSTYSCWPAIKLISNYTKHRAETRNDAFMKGAEWSAPGKLKPAARTHQNARKGGEYHGTTDWSGEAQ